MCTERICMRDCWHKRQNRIWEVIDSSNNYFSICDAPRAAQPSFAPPAARAEGWKRVMKAWVSSARSFVRIHSSDAGRQRRALCAMCVTITSLSLSKHLARHMLFLQNNLILAAEFNPWRARSLCNFHPRPQRAPRAHTRCQVAADSPTQKRNLSSTALSGSMQTLLDKKIHD